MQDLFQPFSPADLDHEKAGVLGQCLGPDESPLLRAQAGPGVAGRTGLQPGAGQARSGMALQAVSAGAVTY